MTFPKARAIVAACLFLTWIGLLFFQVLERRPVILSRPQFLIAQTIVVAELHDANGFPGPDVAVKEVLWPKGDRLSKIELPELAEFGKTKGYHGAGLYLIPLLQRDGRFDISPRPPFDKAQMPWIYPWTPEIQAQAEQIIAAKN